MSTGPNRPKRFLFVDDDAAFLGTLRELFLHLSAGSWEIATAQNHAQALAQMNRQRPDVLVLDIGMPILDGVQFLRLLGRSHPGQPVVMLTGLANETNRKQCLDNGAALILEKPAGAEGFTSIFSALDAFAGTLVQTETAQKSEPVAAQTASPAQTVRIEEILLSSSAGNVLYQWQCPFPEQRLELIAQIARQAEQLGGLIPAGRFERAEILTKDGRIVCQVQSHRQLLVRSSRPKGNDK